MPTYFKEAEFSTALHEKIIPFLHARRTEQVVTATDGTTLHTLYYKADAPRGTVIWIHGFSENADKYREMIYYCLLDGLSVLIYDQRGHGRSTRKAPLGVIHVDKFEDYLTDFQAVFAAYEAVLHTPLYLFGHSMGGAVAALILEQHPDRFRRAALSAPMLDLTYRGGARAVAMLTATAACLFTNCQKPIPVRKKDASKNSLAHSNYRSPARFQAVRDLTRENPLLGGGTPSRAWAHAALGVRRKIFKKGAPAGIKTPVLLFSAEKETLVSNEAHARFATLVPQVTHITVPDVRHEILFAEDEKSFPVIERMLAFFA